MSKRISLTKGMSAVIDDADFKMVSRYKWKTLRDKYTFYALANVVVDGKHTTIRMHRLIMGAKSGEIVDHKDGNGLNNLRSNLRICTHSENNKNRVMHKKFTSKYKGVYRPANRNKWLAAARIDGKRVHLGSFDSEIDAAKAYDKAARLHYGKFAKTNF